MPPETRGPLLRGRGAIGAPSPLGAAEGAQFLNCRPKPAARFCVDAGRLERRPFRAAEGEQFFNCRPKPAARFCVDAGRRLKERFPRIPHFSLYSAQATLAAKRTLLSTNWMLEAKDSPPVSSHTRASRKGVVALPLIPCSAASRSA